MENIENIMENVEDVVTTIPVEAAVPVNTFGGLKAAGLFGLGVAAGILVYEGGKRAIGKLKAKKADKNEVEEVVVDPEDFVGEDESK